MHNVIFIIYGSLMRSPPSASTALVASSYVKVRSHNYYIVYRRLGLDQGIINQSVGRVQKRYSKTDIYNNE